MPLRFWIPLLAPLAVGCSLLAPLPPKTTTQERLAAFPVSSLPLERPVTVYWNDALVPYISAQTEGDGAFVLGLVHAHLRLAQMEFLRKVASARLSEIAGPFARDIDHTLRIVNLSKAVGEIRRILPPETRAWVERYVEGINLYKRTVRARSADFVAMNLDESPWSVDDVIRFTRLAGVDVSWLVLARYLRHERDPGFRKYWPEFLAKCAGKEASFATLDGAERLMGLGRIGSNSLVIGPRRTRSGKPLVANDPHLGLSLPNLWLIAGIKTPGLEAVGLMFPGAPFVALGRNTHLAWGGTNMRSLSSELVDVTELDPSRWSTRTEHIQVRFWGDREVEVRETPYGPVLSDSPLFSPEDGGRKWALKWVGHQVSDELTTFYRMNRARNWKEFRNAFETYAVGAQNFLFADVEGNIGQILAARLPRRKAFPQDRVQVTPTEVDESWEKMWGPLDLPFVLNPQAGFLASANNLPTERVPVGRFFSSDDRVRRLKQLASGRTDWDVEQVRQVQRDVFSPSSLAMRDFLAGLLRDEALRTSPWGKAFLGWDGHYRASSRGPVAYQTLMHHLVGLVFEPEFGETVVEHLRGNDCHVTFLEDRLEKAGAKAVEHVREAALEAKDDFGEFSDWGDMHRVKLAHVLGNVPLVGGKYRFGEYPADGSASTLLKTSHALARERHHATYGAQARHISDLSDADANYFVLLGGQDGWIPSPHLTDQVPLWRKGDALQVPLKESTVAKQFGRSMILKPANDSET